MHIARSKESVVPFRLAGIPMLILGVVLGLTFVPLIVFGALAAQVESPRAPILLVGAFLDVALTVLILRGLVLVNPNHAKLVLLFGDYRGTLRSAGLHWVNPFTARKPMSLRAFNFNSETLKVNDQRGNPIEIGAVVVWRVKDTAQAGFDVEDHESYVEVQSESALRHLASIHPYDVPEGDETSLRGDATQINRELQEELTRRLDMGGIEVLEARLSHLAYAPEIAGAMLQRQQATAIVDARTRIVDGAVGMVQMALDQLKSKGILELDEERKATMVSNLLVVLCSERGTTPVVNAGSLYN
jgi:regulator of protease activity HflC (stomatin/prohibitin superfamily)